VQAFLPDQACFTLRLAAQYQPPGNGKLLAPAPGWHQTKARLHQQQGATVVLKMN